MSGAILVTGSNGFIGRELVLNLAMSHHDIRRCTREKTNSSDIAVGELGPSTDWKEALVGVDAVFHLAALAHVQKTTLAESLEYFRRVNTEGTLALARQAADAGVRRFVFVSSIGVNGIESQRPFSELSPPNPVEPYAISKLEAEIGLWKVADATGMEVVVIRPVLVYGPGAPGNFGRLMRWVGSGVPLPLGAVRQNKRSFIGLDNLVDLMVTCLDHPSAANQVFLAGDGEDMSTADLLRRLGVAMGRPVRLLPVPLWMLEGASAVFGKRDLARRLLGSLQVDISKAREVLGWEPAVSVDEGLRRAVGGLEGAEL